jgi:hypothetical protein
VSRLLKRELQAPSCARKHCVQLREQGRAWLPDALVLETSSGYWPSRRVVQQLVKSHVVPNLLHWQHVAGVACCCDLHGYPFLQRLHGVLWYVYGVSTH